MQTPNGMSMGTTFVGRLGAAAAISLVLTLLLMLIFQADAPPAASEMLEASGGAPSLSEPGIRPISLR